MERTYILHLKNGNKVISESDAINNALEQESSGICPHYAFYDYKKAKSITPKGWLVWSTMDGCGVVYRRHDGKMIVCSGVQSDFCYY